MDRGIKINIITRDPVDHTEMIGHKATNEVLFCKELGINIILLRVSHHRKIAIVDRSILWEDSLNMLSLYSSQEIIGRIEGKKWAIQMFDFLKFKKVINQF